MLSFVAKRIFSGIVVLFAVAVIAYALLFAGAGDIARNIMGDQASEEAVELRRQQLGLDQPLGTRLIDWMVNAVQGEFGNSWFTNQPVFEAIGNRLPLTLVMVFVTIIIIAVVATLMAMLAAVKRGGWDRLVQVLAIVGSALPGFIIGVVLVMVFAVQLGWFDAVGRISPNSDLSVWITSLTLPIIALFINGVASTAQQLRSAIIKQLEQDYVRTLRSRGISENEILFKHVLRAAAPAGLTVLSLQFISLLGGVVIIESIFALPGIGSLAVTATTQGDLPIVMGVVIYTVVIVIIVNLIVDVLNGWLNPKVRVS